jgi:hypothetical protein
MDTMTNNERLAQFHVAPGKNRNQRKRKWVAAVISWPFSLIARAIRHEIELIKREGLF